MSEPRTCPTCNAALPPDAPEGTCPKCLLAAGFESADGRATGDGPGLSEVAAEFPELEILEELGRGGMGVVYKARQKRLDRLVALKVLPRELAESAPDAARFEDRFTREARALARLSHPNIVAVHEFGERHGMYYFLMEFVDGANLRQTMRAGQLSPAEALAIVPQICDALQYAHDQGVVHRDIKPENVLIDVDGKVKIADFGLAKLVTRAADDRTLTRQGLVMGTPHYMAPEQLEKPSEVDHRADIYSLGVVLYEMLTGELPLGRFAPPSEKVRVDVRMDEVVLRSLEKERDRRYQAVSEVKTGIGAVDLSRGAGPPARNGHAVRKDGSYSRLALWGLLLPLVSVAFGGVAVFALGALLEAPDREGAVGLHWSMILATVQGAAVLGGLALSIAGIVQIRRSGGRLRGMGLAIAGLLLPFLCCLPAATLPMMWLSARAPVMPPFPDPAPGPGSAGAAVEDLGPIRIEIDLEADEAVFAPQRVRLLGSQSPGLNSHRNTAAKAPWPPEPGMFFQVRRVERRGETTSSDAALVLGEEIVAAIGREDGAAQDVEAWYVSADAMEQLQVEFRGGERQRVVVTGNVVRVQPRDGAEEEPGTFEVSTERIGSASLEVSVPERANELGSLLGTDRLGDASGEPTYEWPLAGGRMFIVETLELTRGSAARDVRLTLNGRTFELAAGETGRVWEDLEIVLDEATAAAALVENLGSAPVTLRVEGRVIRVWKPDDGGR